MEVARSVAPWRDVLFAAVVAVGSIAGLALAGWLFFVTWGAISGLQFALRPTVLFLTGLVLPLAGGLFIFWLAWAVGQRIRSPARQRTGLDQDLPLLAQLGLATGLLVGVIVTAYDSYLASYDLGRSTNIAILFLTGVVPVIVGLLAATPLVVISMMFSREIGVWERGPAGNPRTRLTWRATLHVIAHVAGATVAVCVFLIAIKLGWNYFFRDAYLQGVWPRAFWIVLLVYAAALVAGAFYYPFFACARAVTPR